MKSNIYEYLLQGHPYLPSIFALCGAEGKYTTEGSSDYEKFRELCKILIRFSGSDFYRDINASVSELFGEKIQLSESVSEYLWRKYYGEGEISHVTPSTLKIRIVDTTALSNAVSLGGVREFEKPDIYHVSLAKEARASGEPLSTHDADMLKIQEARERAEKCKKGSGVLLLDARECSIEILCKTVDYLDTCGLLYKTVIALELDSIRMDELLTLSKYEEISFCVCLDGRVGDLGLQIERVAQNLPIGAVYVCIAEVMFSELKRAMQNQMSLWRRDGRAHVDSKLEIERTQTFY